MANPIDEAFDILAEQGKLAFPTYKPSKPLSPVAQRELDMWKTWDKNGRKPSDLRPLVKSLQPLVNNRMKLFKNSLRDIPSPIIKHEFHNKLVNALDSFDPNRGRMSTHITNHLKQVDRFVKTYQNDARASEEMTSEFGAYNRAHNLLRDTYGREPTTFELADHMKIPVKRVQAIQQQNIKSYGAGSQKEDPRTFVPSKTKQILDLLPYEIDDPEELNVFEHLHGTNGKPQLKPSEIAKKLGFSPAKVTRIRNRLAKKWNQYDT